MDFKSIEFKKINEDLISLVERTIDPKFRDALQASRDSQNAGLQREIDRNKQSAIDAAARGSDPEYWEKEAKEVTDKLLGKKSADFVYNELYHKGLAVDQATIEFIGNGKELDAKKLKKIIKEKLPADKGYDRQNHVFLIADTHKPESIRYGSPERARSGFVVWEAGYTDGTFYLDSWTRTKAIEPYEKGRVLMADLNKGNCNYDFYLAFGPDVKDKQNARRDAKDGVIKRYKRSDLNKWDQEDFERWFDKSGYDVQQFKKELMQRLQDYKKKNGAYTEQAEEVQNKLKDIETRIREFMSNIDIKDYTAAIKLKEILDGYRSFCWETDSFLKEIEKDTATDKSVNLCYRDCIEKFNKLNARLQ